MCKFRPVPSLSLLRAMVRGAIALAFLSSFALPAFAAGDDVFTITPAVTARETFDSNVNFNGQGDFEHRLVPSLNLGLQDERLRGYLKGTGTEYVYTKLSGLNRFDQNYDGYLEANATERLTASLTTNAIVDHTVGSSLSETGQLAQMVMRKVYTVSPTVSYQLTERNSATIFGSVSQTKYASTQYVNSDSKALGGRWGYMYDERTTVLFQVADTRTQEPNAKQSVLTTMGGFDYFIAETLKAHFLAGLSSMSSQDAGVSTTSRGYAVDSSLQWTGETTSATAGYGRDMSVDLSGNNIVRDRFNLSASKNLSERFQALLSANFVQSKTAGNLTTTQTTRWFEVDPAIQYQTSEHSTLALGYGYGIQEAVETGVVQKRTQVYLNFSISFP